jgi:hypothetical protein
MTFFSLFCSGEASLEDSSETPGVDASNFKKMVKRHVREKHWNDNKK